MNFFNVCRLPLSDIVTLIWNYWTHNLSTGQLIGGGMTPSVNLELLSGAAKRTTFRAHTLLHTGGVGTFDSTGIVSDGVCRRGIQDVLTSRWLGVLVRWGWIDHLARLLVLHFEIVNRWAILFEEESLFDWVPAHKFGVWNDHYLILRVLLLVRGHNWVLRVLLHISIEWRTGRGPYSQDIRAHLNILLVSVIPAATLLEP
jgi:hypothetical protein